MDMGIHAIIAHSFTTNPMIADADLDLDGIWYDDPDDATSEEIYHKKGDNLTNLQEYTNGDGIGDACCCVARGNADGDGGINVADLTYLVDYLFFSGPVPPCPEEGNVDAEGDINVADLTYLVDYIFFSGPAPPPCQ